MNIIDFIMSGEMGTTLINYLLDAKYIGIFIAMLINGIAEFPSSQIMYPIVGYYASIGKLNMLAAIISGALGNTIGNYFLYLLSIKYQDRILNRLSHHDQQKINSVMEKLAHRSRLWLILGKLIPGVKTFIPIVAALMRVNRYTVVVILLLGSIIWSALLISMGYYGVKIFQLYL